MCILLAHLVDFCGAEPVVVLFGADVDKCLELVTAVQWHNFSQNSAVAALLPVIKSSDNIFHVFGEEKGKML